MDTDTSAKYLGFARLNDQQLSELLALEEDLGVVIIALKPTVPLANPHAGADQLPPAVGAAARHHRAGLPEVEARHDLPLHADRKPRRF